VVPSLGGCYSVTIITEMPSQPLLAVPVHVRGDKAQEREHERATSKFLLARNSNGHAFALRYRVSLPHPTTLPCLSCAGNIDLDAKLKRPPRHEYMRSFCFSHFSFRLSLAQNTKIYYRA